MKSYHISFIIVEIIKYDINPNKNVFIVPLLIYLFILITPSRTTYVVEEGKRLAPQDQLFIKRVHGSILLHYSIKKATLKGSRVFTKSPIKLVEERIVIYLFFMHFLEFAWGDLSLHDF